MYHKMKIISVMKNVIMTNEQQKHCKIYKIIYYHIYNKVKKIKCIMRLFASKTKLIYFGVRLLTPL